MKRKCIALADHNYDYVDDLVQKGRSKNFSRAINEMIEKDKEGNYATEDSIDNNQHSL